MFPNRVLKGFPERSRRSSCLSGVCWMLRWGPSVAEMSSQLGSHQGCVLGLSQRSHDVRECFAYSSTHRRGASGILMPTHLGSQQIGSVGFPAPALGLLVCLAGLFSVNIRFMWETARIGHTVPIQHGVGYIHLSMPIYLLRPRIGILPLDRVLSSQNSHLKRCMRLWSVRDVQDRR